MTKTWLERTKGWARERNCNVVALWIATRDPRTPLLAKLIAGAVATCALSPIDLIPDVIPVLGSLDDLLIVPLGSMLAVQLVPQCLTVEYRNRAVQRDTRTVSRMGLLLILCIRLMTKAGVALLLWPGLVANWTLHSIKSAFQSRPLNADVVR